MKPLEAAIHVTIDVTECFKVCASETKVSKLRKTMTGASQSLSNIIDGLKENHPGKFIKVRKNLQRNKEVLDGLLNGIESRSLTRSSLQQTIAKVQNEFLPALSAAITAEVERGESEVELTSGQLKTVAKLDRSISSSAMQAALANIAPSFMKVKVSPLYRSGDDDGADRLRADRAEQTATNKLREQIDELKAQVNDMPTKMKGKFAMFSFPVIPVFKKYSASIRAENFRKIGILATDIDDTYCALLNQSILAFSKTFAAQHNQTPLQMAQAILHLLHERGNPELVLVSDKPCVNPKNTDILMFWCMPPKKLYGFTDKVARGLTGDMSWNFPVSS